MQKNLKFQTIFNRQPVQLNEYRSDMVIFVGYMRLIWQRYFELFASVKLGNLAGHNIQHCSSQVERLPDYLQPLCRILQLKTFWSFLCCECEKSIFYYIFNLVFNCKIAVQKKSQVLYWITTTLQDSAVKNFLIFPMLRMWKKHFLLRI